MIYAAVILNEIQKKISWNCSGIIDKNEKILMSTASLRTSLELLPKCEQNYYLLA